MSDVAVFPVELIELDETYDIDVDTNQLMNVELATPIQVVSSNDYEDLINKPSINGVELSGNESLSDLSIPTDTADLTNGAGFISSETDPVFLASPAHGIASSDIASWNNKSDFSGSYNDLDDKPTIPTVPTNVSAFNNDAGYLTSYTETDPTVPNWAKASTKPSYTASEVHALPDTTVIPSKVSDLTNDAGYITGYTETDPTVPAWAKASNKPTYTASEVGALPNTTPIPSKTSDLTNDSGFITTAIYHGTCSSAAADTTKVVACSGFTLFTGAAILVTFSATNSAAVADLQMNVNSTGAKGIKYINNGTLGALTSAGYLKASTTYFFIYDGTYWVTYFNYNTTYSGMTDAEIAAGTGTSNRTITPARLKTAVQTWEHVNSVNGQTGAVTLTIPTVPTNVSSFNNDAGYLTLATLPIYNGGVS